MARQYLYSEMNLGKGGQRICEELGQAVYRETALSTADGFLILL